MHAFIPQAVIASDDSDAIVVCDDEEDLMPKLPGLQISINKYGEIDIRRVDEPCTLRHSESRSLEAQHLIQARQRDVLHFKMLKKRNVCQVVRLVASLTLLYLCSVIFFPYRPPSLNLQTRCGLIQLLSFLCLTRRALF